jgi:hypothetical protein
VEFVLNLFNPVISKVIKIKRSKIAIKAMNPVKEFPTIHCGIANTIPASGGYCHIESSMGKIPCTKPLAQKLYKSTSPLSQIPSGYGRTKVMIKKSTYRETLQEKNKAGMFFRNKLIDLTS